MKLVFKILISTSILGLIIWKMGGLREVTGLIVSIDPRYVLLILLINTADRALMTFKWVWLLRGRSVYLPFFKGMKIYCASMVWGIFLPSTIGADAIRAFSTSRTGLDSNEIIASIIIERITGFLSALLLGMLSFILISQLSNLGPRFDPVFWLGGFMLACATFIFISSFSQKAFDLIHGHLLFRFQHTRVMQRFRQFHLTYREYRNDKLKLATFFGLTFGEQLMPIFHSWLIALGLGVKVNILFFVAALPLAILISRLPISIDGLGVFEGVFILLMSMAGVTTMEAVAIAFTGRILQTISWLPWWIAYVIGSGTMKPPRPILDEK